MQPAPPELFTKVDIRVCGFDKVWAHPDSEKLYCEMVNTGLEAPIQVASGLRQFITPENMSGQVLVIVNMKPRKLAGFESQGMVLCGSNSDHTVVELLQPTQECKIGERVFLEGAERPETWDTERIAVLNPKKKELEAVLPKLVCDEEGFATFEGRKLTTGSGAFFRCKTLKGCSIS